MSEHNIEKHIHDTMCILKVITHIRCDNFVGNDRDKIAYKTFLYMSFLSYLKYQQKKDPYVIDCFNRWSDRLMFMEGIDDPFSIICSKIQELNPDNSDHDKIKKLFVEYWNLVK